MKFNKLTQTEKDIILNKATEAPYSGKYNKHDQKGVYLCKRCDSPLYSSTDKFNSECGWPSFDHAILGAVKKKLDDSDGKRTEIVCTTCKGHLGHVFEGEKLTEKNKRYCTNSLSLKFKSEIDKKEIAVFGGGCFWCLEPIFKKLNGVLEVEVGYAGGKIANPTYEMVSGGNTDYTEVVKVVFDRSVISYNKLVEVFFKIHDPTSLNRQGDDKGYQYRSVIFYSGERQRYIALNYIKNLDENDVFNQEIVTAVEKLNNYYKAEDYHQEYYRKNKKHPYCKTVIDPKLKKFSKNNDK